MSSVYILFLQGFNYYFHRHRRVDDASCNCFFFSLYFFFYFYFFPRPQVYFILPHALSLRHYIYVYINCSAEEAPNSFHPLPNTTNSAARPLSYLLVRSARFGLLVDDRKTLFVEPSGQSKRFADKQYYSSLRRGSGASCINNCDLGFTDQLLHFYVLSTPSSKTPNGRIYYNERWCVPLLTVSTTSVT